MAKIFSVQNWDKYQARTDKDLPWCKLWGTFFETYWFSEIPDSLKLLPIIFLDLARKHGNKIPKEALIEANLSKFYGINQSQLKVNNLCKLLKTKGFLSDECPTDVGLDKDKIREDKIRLDKEISSQIEDLLISFSQNGLQEKINTYLETIASKNKHKAITNPRKKMLLLELSNARQRCNDDGLFTKAVDGALKYGACNIGYINAIIKNQKTQRPK